MSPEGASGRREDGCPEPEQLAAYIDGRLPPAERTEVERHLVGCADCRDIVGDAFAETSAPATVIRPKTTRWIAVTAGALAAAAAIVMVVRLQGPRSADVPEIAKLAQAVGNERVIEPRLTGGFAHGPVPSARGGTTGPAIPPRVVIAATGVKNDVAGRTDPASDSARGVADLLLGNADAAIAALERAAAATHEARQYANLSAAYLVHAKSTGDRADLQRAADNADRALQRDPNLEEAYF